MFRGLRFQKRLNLLPGVRVNLSKSGASTSIGPRGADVNIGANGVTTNAGIPGTGLSYRQKVGGGHSHGMLGVAAIVGGLAVWGFQHLDKITHVFTPAQQAADSASPPQASEKAGGASQAAVERSPVNTAAPGLRFVHRGGSILRASAKTSGHKLKKEVKGARVTLLSLEGDGWAKVTDGNITGWMRASVLGVDPPH